MNTYITGTAIKQLRESRGMTQAELAEKIGVSSKTISKWETAKGLPDISMLQPLAQTLGVSVIELMDGRQIVNKNVSANMMRGKFYVCPICGNLIQLALQGILFSLHRRQICLKFLDLGCAFRQALFIPLGQRFQFCFLLSDSLGLLLQHLALAVIFLLCPVLLHNQMGRKRHDTCQYRCQQQRQDQSFLHGPTSFIC